MRHGTKFGCIEDKSAVVKIIQIYSQRYYASMLKKRNFTDVVKEHSLTKYVVKLEKILHIYGDVEISKTLKDLLCYGVSKNKVKNLKSKNESNETGRMYIKTPDLICLKFIHCPFRYSSKFLWLPK